MGNESAQESGLASERKVNITKRKSLPIGETMFRNKQEYSPVERASHHTCNPNRQGSSHKRASVCCFLFLLSFRLVSGDEGGGKEG